MKEVQNKIIEAHKIHNELIKKSRIFECFHHNKNECRGRIKRAHSIQRNGRLSIIEGNVNGNAKIYSFTDIDLNPKTKEFELKPIGKADASTFFGFCDYHDCKLFEEIENKGFEESHKHCFLHSYRAFVHTHHRKIEQLNAYKSNAEFNKLYAYMTPDLIQGTKIGIFYGERVRRRFECLLDKEEYSDLIYVTIVLNDLFPIACSAAFTPKFSPKSNRELNFYPSAVDYFQYVFLTVLPDFNQTIIIMACLPEDKKSILFLDEFHSMAPLQQELVLSSILIGEVENTFIAPALYEALGKQGKKQLLKELEETTIYAERKYGSIHKSKINWFRPSYSAERLGIKYSG